MNDPTLELARQVGRLSWAVDELLYIIDDRGDGLHLTETERKNLARARVIADAARPGGAQ